MERAGALAGELVDVESMGNLLSVESKGLGYASGEDSCAVTAARTVALRLG